MLAYETVRETITRSNFLPTIAVLVGILILLLLIGFRIRARFLENDSDNAVDPEEMLVQYEELRRQGQLTDSEFRSIKNQILPSHSHIAELDGDD